MDDSLETPNPLFEPSSNREADDEHSSEDEYEGPDWTKLILPGDTRPVIPKRGEKDFEPAPGGGSGLQQHILNQSRNAMFEALRAPRNSSSKSISHGIWYPGMARVHVTLARGIHFSAMGHSVPRPQADDPSKSHKRLELLPEEAIYLIERGSLFCWKDIGFMAGTHSGLEDMQGVPMSVQQAYAEMIGAEGLTLEKYQVFAHLRRLGYVVTRAEPPSSAYPIPSPFSKTIRKLSLLQRFRSWLSGWISKTHLWQSWQARISWFGPLFRHSGSTYPSIFKALRIIPSGHDVAVTAPPPSTPYKIFFNIYKPSTAFRKTAPPPPDFSVVVINARTTPMPTYNELSALFEVLPELPPPLPRQRYPSAGTNTLTARSTSTPNFIQRFISWMFSRSPNRDSLDSRRPNPFMALKAGKKSVVIAAVDVVNISFFRFGQGAFCEWPMI